ncbi:hypothetical protein GURASL_13460 [Geotalea uraniireducens]|uniref:Uncharacterized protein n=1 Tax=Geotalea uraniireducens TaxID=351604 RepID=A0ABN6VQ43_9BACT|nr:hypothetical protein [Geotalea uraniireducens]BDV42423.1 hypothetical protein GURASL_13460 [Geotalea uraniireducens]
MSIFKRFAPPVAIFSISLLVAMILAAACGLALAADPVAAATPVVTPGVPQASLFAWFRQNLVYVLGVALAISELLGVIPTFQGNGVLDSIIKSLKFLISKTTTPPAA